MIIVGLSIGANVPTKRMTTVKSIANSKPYQDQGPWTQLSSMKSVDIGRPDIIRSANI